MTKSRLFMVVFISVLGTLLTAVMTMVNDYTEPFIRRNKDIKLKSSVLEALGVSAGKADEVEKLFDASVRVEEADGGSARLYEAAGVGTAFEVSGKGLWGPIKAVVALDVSGEKLLGVAVVHQEETPGLGAKIAEPEFLARLKDKKISPRLLFVPPGTASAPNEADAVTGATMTSKAFEEILNAGISKNAAAMRNKK